MKKILKKNQIIITALVVMVAIAGYLSMTDREELTMNGHGDHNKAATESAADISEEDIVLDEDEETADAASGKAVSTSGQKVSNKENAGEAVLVSNTVTGNYFEEAKLSREQTRAKNKETLTNLVNNKNVTNAADYADDRNQRKRNGNRKSAGSEGIFRSCCDNFIRQRGCCCKCR